MPKRAPADPPRLPGYDALELIGSGGYADVFLYQQANPERLVAMKVLVPEAIVADGGVSDFAAEANVMAKVSSHPYIVQVFEVGVSPDGRPFLAMEYYPGANFYDRARREQMTVAEALQTGVNLASAVETAHRANILHRDIKPANILTSEYHWPGLTDFGIASVQGPNQTKAEGLSIPWAPPEAFGDADPDARSDIYSLAATVYTLLAGRSPFEVPGGDNTPLALMSRVEHHPVPGLGRADVPPSLERVLEVAMSKNAAHRPATAAEFGRQLNAVESEMKLAVTPLQLAGGTRAYRSRAETDDDDSTRIKNVTEVTAQPTAGLIRGAGTATVGDRPLPQREREGMLGEPDLSDTVIPDRRSDQPAQVEEFEADRIKPVYLWAGGAAALVAVIVAASFVLGGSGSSSPTADEPTDFAVNDGFDSPVAAAPPPVGEIQATDNGDGSFSFRWESPAEDLAFIVTEVDGAGPTEIEQTQYDGFVECIEVESKSISGLISAATRACA